MRPNARRDELVVEEVAEELVIYDEKRKFAHTLNRAAAMVWRNCDGERSINDLVNVLRAELDPIADEDLVLVALDELEASHLLETPIGRTADQARASRRQVVRKVGRVGVMTLLLPAIVTLVAPTPAKADSGGCGSS